MIPITRVFHNKASFGDVIRNKPKTDEDYTSMYESIDELQSLLQINNIQLNSYSIYQNLNMTSDYRIAIYGDINKNNITYIEVPRKFDILQHKARLRSISVGEPIPKELQYQHIETVPIKKII